MTDSANPLLLGRRAPAITTSPFFYFEVPDFLPSDVYAEALAAFPRREFFADPGEGNKLRFGTKTTPNVVKDLSATYPVWKKILGWMEDDAFLEDLYELVRGGLVASRGVLGARRWSFNGQISPLRALRYLPASTEFEFSRLERGALVPPHTDSINKLVSALLYFPDPDWQESYGGDTLYYRAKNPAHQDNWHNSRLDADQLTTFHVNKFAPNRLCVFLKSAHSHHGVSTIQCPEGMARNSLNFNVFYSPGPTMQRLRRTQSRALRQLQRFREGRPTANTRPTSKRRGTS